jgi:hypothetical protein
MLAIVLFLLTILLAILFFSCCLSAVHATRHPDALFLLAIPLPSY